MNNAIHDARDSLDPEDAARPAASPVPGQSARHPDLAAEIARARQAAQAVSAQDALRAEAERLPALQAELDARQQRAQAAAHLARATAEAKARLADLRPQVADLNRRYAETVSALEMILAQKDALQAKIVQAGRDLRQAGANERAIQEAGFSDSALSLLPGPHAGEFGPALWRFLLSRRPPFDASIWHQFI